MRLRLGHLGFKAKCLVAIFVVFILFSSLSAVALHTYRQHELRSLRDSSPHMASPGLSARYSLRLLDLGYIFASGLIPALAVALLVLDKSVASRLRHIIEVADAVRLGDHYRGVEVEGWDEISQLEKSLNRAFSGLRHGREKAVKKINSLRQFNELMVRERHGNDGVIMVDREGKITYANAKSMDLLGYCPEELVGRDLFDFLIPTSREDIGEFPLSQRGPNNPRRSRVVFRDKAEALVPANITNTDLFREGQLTGSLLVLTDLRNRDDLVGDLKDIQSRLRQSSIELGRRLWELSVVREVTHTLQGTLSLDEVLRIILTGVTAEQGLGFNRAFLLLLDQQDGRLKGELAVGPSNPQEAEWIWEGLRNQSHTLKELLERHRDASGQFDPGLNEIVKRMEFELIPDGSIVARAVLEGRNFNIMEASKDPRVDGQCVELLGTETFVVVPLIARGKPLGVVIADNYFTHRPIEEADVELLNTLASHASFAIERAHLYEQLMNQVQELERAYGELKESQNQLLRAERLSAVGKMATRLAHEMRNPIVSLGGFARLISKGLPREDPNQEYLNIITEEVARLEKLLGEVLDFVRPAKPSFEMVDLNELIQRAMVMMQPEIDKRQIKVHADLQATLPKIKADPLQIIRVLMNIIRNGLEAMSGGGSLFVRTQNLGDRLRVEIEDTGVGIPEEHLDKLFSEFFTTKSSGVGLGLAVAYQSIYDHRGAISVHSQQGKGSTFAIDLPLDIEGSVD
jgi:PAS domain S-box-containing protein